ncbi:MAG: hypothetical protein ACRD0V_01105 [Acidimicrobiales bacterium]
MTTPRDPDDLASALLDGLLTEDEAAAARRDPAVVSRLAELAAVREAVGTPPASADPTARERAVAAALAAYEAGDVVDAGDDRHEHGESVAAVSPMSRGHAAGRPSPSRAGMPWRAHGGARGRWLTAAAVMLVVVCVSVLASNWDTGSDDSGSAAREVATDEGSGGGGGTGGAAEGAETGESNEGTAAAGAADGIVDLGDVDSSQALADRVRSILAERSSRAAPDASGGEDLGEQEADGDAGFLSATCGDDAEAEVLASAPVTVVLQARATLHGKPVDVWVLGGEGEERVVAVDASCAVVADQPLQK